MATQTNKAWTLNLHGYSDDRGARIEAFLATNTYDADLMDAAFDIEVKYNWEKRALRELTSKGRLISILKDWQLARLVSWGVIETAHYYDASWPLQSRFDAPCNTTHHALPLAVVLAKLEGLA